MSPVWAPCADDVENAAERVVEALTDVNATLVEVSRAIERGPHPDNAAITPDVLHACFQRVAAETADVSAAVRDLDMPDTTDLASIVSTLESVHAALLDNTNAVRIGALMPPLLARLDHPGVGKQETRAIVTAIEAMCAGAYDYRPLLAYVRAKESVVLAFE